MSEHTPEPWFANGSEIRASNPKAERKHTFRPFVAQMLCGPSFSTAEVEANAHRIAACVNACAGLNPEAVPDLLAAAEKVLRAGRAYMEYHKAKFYPGIGGAKVTGITPALDELDAALTKARGGE